MNETTCLGSTDYHLDITISPQGKQAYFAAPCGICYIRAASTVEYNKPIQEVRSRKDGKQVVGIGERTVCTHGSFVEGDRPCFQAK